MFDDFTFVLVANREDLIHWRKKSESRNIRMLNPECDVTVITHNKDTIGCKARM